MPNITAMLQREGIKKDTGLWTDYERAKALLERMYLTSAEYNQAITIIANWVGV